MRRRVVVLGILSFLLVTFCAVASAQSSLESMQLLTPEAGWASTGRQILWTADAGAHWRDITPTMGSTGSLASIFFLDSARGWILLADRDRDTGAARFNLASTISAGASWSITPLNVPDIDPSRGLSDRGWIDFVDPLHGWLMVRMNGNTAVSIGVLLTTGNGGKTWESPSPGPPIAGPLHFVTTKIGWLAGGPEEALYVTYDGGNSWQQVSVAVPPQMHSSAQPTYDPPMFSDSVHGFLAVGFSGPDDQNQELALFASNDRGRTWRMGDAFPQETSAWATTATGSSWIIARTSGRMLAINTRPSSKLGASIPPTDVSADIGDIVGNAPVRQLSFASITQGWALAAGMLLSTDNGGVTWMNVTPKEAKNAHGTLSSEPGQPLSGSDASAGASKQAPSAGTDAMIPSIVQQLGFDITRVIPTSDMQTWWYDSPFWNTGVYLPGSQNRGTDANLTPAWIAAVQSQGWGLIPIWFGRQAPCACAQGSTPGHCVPFTSTISSTITTATQQGMSEASAAIKSANTLGFSPTIIYHDMENYTPSSPPSACDLAVIAFLDGWVSGLHNAKHAAGVYGNPLPAQDDFSQVSPLPDDVWIAQYPLPPNPPKVTTWGLGSLKDNLWVSDQRIHQYLPNVPTTYGGTASHTIDPDIVDATIVAGNGSKSYNFAYSGISYPSAIVTYAIGINNINGSNGQPINGSGQVGQVVGYYEDSAGGVHGFLYNRGAASPFTSIDYPQASSTYAAGINDAGEIVGYYLDASGQHGFLYNPSASPPFRSIDYPSALSTGAQGINDAGQIVGSYYAGGGISGFLYNPRTTPAFNSIDYPGALSTYANGINGDGQIVGTYRDLSNNSAGFLYEAGTPSPFNCPGAQSTVPLGINNNGQVVGFYFDSITTYGFLYQAGSCSVVDGFYGINDNTQLAGYVLGIP